MGDYSDDSGSESDDDEESSESEEDYFIYMTYFECTDVYVFYFLNENTLLFERKNSDW